jgi:hypothetical protein
MRKKLKLPLYFWRRLLTVGLPIFLVLAGCVISISILVDHEAAQSRKLQYSFEPVDKTCDVSRQSCSISVTVFNPTSEVITPQYVDTGGGPFARASYNVKMYKLNGSLLCMGSIADYYRTFDNLTIRPNERKKTKLYCNDHTKDISTAVNVAIYGKRYALSSIPR